MDHHGHPTTLQHLDAIRILALSKKVHCIFFLLCVGEGTIDLDLVLGLTGSEASSVYWPFWINERDCLIQISPSPTKE